MNRLARASLINPWILRLKNVRFTQHSSIAYNKTGKSTNDLSEEIDPNEPIKYFGSPAESWKGKHTRIGTDQEVSERNAYVLIGSVAVFLIYFCILREENDLDLALGRDLFDHFGEEASTLKKAYDYNIKHNLPTGDILQRLQELGAPVGYLARRRQN